MKVVHAHRIAGIGGSERHLLTLLPALAERGVDVSFAGLDVRDAAPDPFYEELGRAGVPFTRTSSPAAFARAVRRARADLVHTHLVHADVVGAVAAGSATLVSTKHNDDPFRAGPFRFVERLLTRRAARVICITESLAHFNRERVGLPAAKLAVVPYGLDQPPPAWSPTELDLPDGKLVAAVARLVPQKGIDVAVEAMAGLDATLVVLGDGPERERLATLAASHGVRLVLPGRVGDVTSVLRRADVLVHPARWEGFGLALLEAMLVGLPVVATAASSIPEIVRDGETGIVVPVGDVGALHAALERVLRDPGTLGAAGRERARREFSVARMAERTLDVYASSERR